MLLVLEAGYSKKPNTCYMKMVFKIDITVMVHVIASVKNSFLARLFNHHQ